MSGMDFELTLRLILGNNAYQTAGLEDDNAFRKKLLLKSIKKIMKDCTTLDTTYRHKEMLMEELKEIYEKIKKCTQFDWNIFYNCLSLIARLLGYDYVEGIRLHIPIFIQNMKQYYKSNILNGKKRIEIEKEVENAMSIRKNIAQELIKKGHSTFFTSLILNTSEYEIKQIKMEK